MDPALGDSPPLPSGNNQDTRSARAACEQCRRRKVRCSDGEPGLCAPCRRLKFICSLGQQREPLQSVHLTTPKIRGSTACYYCRHQKSRCSNTYPQCSTCLRKGRLCVYPLGGRSARNWNGNIPPAEASLDFATPVSGTHEAPEYHSPVAVDAVDLAPRLSHDDSALLAPDGHQSHAAEAVTARPAENPGQQRVDDDASLLALYFEQVYPVPSYSFLHPGMIRDQFACGTLEPCLVHAICAITTILLRRSDSPLAAPKARVHLAEQSIWDNLEKPTLQRIQALLLCVAYRMEMSQFERAFMLAGFAARGATAIRLNYEEHTSTAVVQETRRRTLWSLKILESYFCIGLPENELLPFENVYLQLPAREELYQPSDDTAASEQGAYQSFVRLAAVRRDIVKLNRSIALQDQPFPRLLELINGIEKELSVCAKYLQPLEAMVPALSDKWLPRRMVAKLSWHQGHCDLYRLLLPGCPDAAPATVLDGVDAGTVRYAVQTCGQHASDIIRILSEANQSCHSTPVLEFDTAVCGFHAARLLLFLGQSGLCGDEMSREYSLSRAELCLAAMRRFFRSSALAKPIFREMECLVRDFGQAPNESAYGILAASTDSISQLQGPPEPIRVRQRLAIHSLLRQADFDGTEDGV